jgi:hypothetical protein
VFLAGSGKGVLWSVDLNQFCRNFSDIALSSTIIQDVEAICKAGQGLMIYFYFDFRNANKQRLNDLISSLITQLSVHSDSCCDVLSGEMLRRDKISLG